MMLETIDRNFLWVPLISGKSTKNKQIRQYQETGLEWVLAPTWAELSHRPLHTSHEGVFGLQVYWSKKDAASDCFANAKITPRIEGSNVCQMQGWVQTGMTTVLQFAKHHEHHGLEKERQISCITIFKWEYVSFKILGKFTHQWKTSRNINLVRTISWFKIIPERTDGKTLLLLSCQQPSKKSLGKEYQ